MLAMALMQSGACAAEQPAAQPGRSGDQGDLGVGSWIWTSESADKQTCRLWRAFEIPKGAWVADARLRITADNGYRFMLDGRELGRGSDWRWVSEYDLTWLLEPGTHTLAVEVFNDALEGGLLAGLRIALTSGEVIQVVSDETWWVVPDGDMRWERRRRPEPDWEPALVVGGYDSYPWTDGNRGVVQVPPALPIVLHFWQRGWFQVVLVGLCAVAILISVRLAAKLALQSRAQQVLQRERARIARDIHDDIGSGLTQLVLEGEVAQREFPAGSTPRQRFGQMCERARAVSLALEEVVWAVNSRRDTVRDFVSHVCKHAQNFFQSSAIRCRLDVEPDMPEDELDLMVRRNLFLAVKEALNNAARHSGAREVHVRVRREGTRLVVVVEDNGKGFDPSPGGGEGNGLVNMNERMNEAGGQCIVRGQPGAGCTVEFRVALSSRCRLPWRRIRSLSSRNDPPAAAPVRSGTQPLQDQRQ